VFSGSKLAYGTGDFPLSGVGSIPSYTTSPSVLRFRASVGGRLIPGWDVIHPISQNSPIVAWCFTCVTFQYRVTSSSIRFGQFNQVPAVLQVQGNRTVCRNKVFSNLQIRLLRALAFCHRVVLIQNPSVE